MCGITGFYSYKNKINTKKYYEAHKKIAHRGPDDEGFIYKNNQNTIEYLSGDDTIDELKPRGFIYNKEPSSLILGHRRLSIIDLTSAGHQPFVFENLSLVYNGEIYNYIELRNELKELGYNFDTDSDTEVFLKAYHCWGSEAFNKFNGMWASAIYDHKQDTILLTRDRFGIKPLYYSIVDDNLIFGSEIKFVASFMDKLYANEQMVYEYIEYGYLSHTNKTLFKDIEQLDNGYYGVYSYSGFQKKQYYSIEEKVTINPIQTIKKKLLDAIKIRMRADVEIGSLLSGGMDSSSIVCIIHSEKLKNNMDTFTATYKEKELDFESKYVQDIIKKTDFNNHSIFLEPEDKLVDKLLYILETPYRSFAQNAMFNLYEYIDKNTNIQVVINGSGSDEIFSGYNAHYSYYLLTLLFRGKLFKFFSEIKFIKQRTDRSYSSLFIELFKTLLIHFNFQKYFKKKDIFKNKLSTDRKIKSLNPLRNEILINREYSALPEYLLYEDRISMYFSLEVRVPFLDYNLVSEAHNLKDEDLIKDGITKYTLREAVRGIIPKSVYERKDKKGFFTPHELWLKAKFSKNIELEFNDIKKNGLFSFMKKENIYKLFLNDGFTQKIWRIYLVSRWKKIWKIEYNKKEG